MKKIYFLFLLAFGVDAAAGQVTFKNETRWQCIILKKGTTKIIAIIPQKKEKTISYEGEISISCEAQKHGFEIDEDRSTIYILEEGAGIHQH